MNILMILSKSFTHDPRVYNEAKTLIKAGHKVMVMGWDRRNKYSSRESIDNIDVLRIHNSRFMLKLPNDIFRNPVWWRNAFIKGMNIFNNGFNFDVIHCHDLDTLWAGVRLKKRIGCPLIYDAHEIFSYLIARDVPRYISKSAFLIEQYLIKNVDHIITVNKPLEEYFKTISDKSITVIMNCKNLISKKYESPSNKKFNLIYLGSLHRNRFLLELVDVVEKLPDVHFTIGGIGKADYVYRLLDKINKVENVEFINVIPMEDVIKRTKKADAVISMTDPRDKNCSNALTNKQFEAMVCGRPIICTKGTYPGDFTLKEKCGLVSAYNIKDLGKTIKKLKNNPSLCEELGRNALNAAISKYSWDRQEEKLLDIYKNIESLFIKN
jgi:glycosyltransferase involved in cell wall biosynthesis